MILAELLTGRRPTVDAPAPELRAGDPRSDELEAFLYRCVAAREERFSSAIDAHREIQRMVTGNPFSLYTANLALFLYKLLNPESQLAAPSPDWESTNPVVVDGSSTMSTTRRRRAPEADAPVLAEPAATPFAAAEPAPEPVAGPRGGARERGAGRGRRTPGGGGGHGSRRGARSGRRLRDVCGRVRVARADGQAQAPQEEAGLEEHSSMVVFRFPPEGTAGLPEPELESLEPPLLSEEPASRAAVIPAEVTESPVLLWATAWTRPATALAAAAGLTIGAFLLVSAFRADTRASASPAVRTAKAVLPPAPSLPELPPAPQPGAPQISIAAAAPVAVALSGTAGRFETAAARPHTPARPSKPAPAPSRQPAEDLRLRAALARIEADRLNAKQSASDLFGEGRNNEEEGERLLRERDYQAAELAFSRAARLFQKAQEISWEQRLREIQSRQRPIDFRLPTPDFEPSARHGRITGRWEDTGSSPRG